MKTTSEEGETIMKMFKLFVILSLIMILSNSRAKAEFIYGEPVIAPTVNSEYYDSAPYISADGLELYFSSNRPNNANIPGFNLWVSKRSTTNEPWSAPEMLDPPVNSTWPEVSPCISADGLELYFTDGFQEFIKVQPNPEGYGNGDLWVSRRPSKDEPWGERENLGQIVNSAFSDDHPSISSDGLSLYFMSDRPGGLGGTDIWVTTRESKSHPWPPPTCLDYHVNSSSISFYQSTPFISSDGLSLFFTNGYEQSQIYVCKRTTTRDAWGTSTKFSPIDLPDVEYYLSFSNKASILYFSHADNSYYLKSYDIWQVEVTPLVDFNGDAFVDDGDVSIMVDAWSTNETLCDIAPPPMGDGVVDFQDLAVLSDYVSPPLTVYWTLDESEGVVAANSVVDTGSVYDGFVMGGATWEPSGGQIGGALRFDGFDDYVISPTPVNPSKDSFSILLRIQGGAPRQAIISEPLGSNWLMLDAEGYVVTELKGSDGSPLVSNTTINDGLWHQLGLVWDGSSRKLYIDGALVAEDVQKDLESPSNSLYIGTNGKTEAGTFFSGLIDDICVFNRALTEKQIKGFICAK